MAESTIMLGEELVRWRRRQQHLEETLRRLSEEEERLTHELVKAEKQLAYYSSLTSDMKRELEPPSLASMLKSFRRV
jgi:predicted  nucleic acid-binding Zn-ribbon protein